MSSKIITLGFNPEPYLSYKENPLLEKFETITEFNLWKEYTEKLINHGRFDRSSKDEYKISFHNYWTISGHNIRKQIDNDYLLLELLSIFLPKYNNEGLTLYRGENLDSFNSEKIGFCWTSSLDKAKQFASGSNRFGSGGILLKCECKSDWILSGPSAHSYQLGENEYTVNPFSLNSIETLEVFNE